MRDLHFCGSFMPLDLLLPTNGCSQAGLEPYNHIHPFSMDSKNLPVFRGSHSSKTASPNSSPPHLVAPLALTSHIEPSCLAPFWLPRPHSAFQIPAHLFTFLPHKKSHGVLWGQCHRERWGKWTHIAEPNREDVRAVRLVSCPYRAPLIVPFHCMEISIHRIMVSFFFITLPLHFEEVVMRLAPLTALQYTSLSGCIYRTGFLTA